VVLPGVTRAVRRHPGIRGARLGVLREEVGLFLLRVRRGEGGIQVAHPQSVCRPYPVIALQDPEMSLTGPVPAYLDVDRFYLPPGLHGAHEGVHVGLLVTEQLVGRDIGVDPLLQHFDRDPVSTRCSWDVAPDVTTPGIGLL
jgi:hypothetical protein